MRRPERSIAGTSLVLSGFSLLLCVNRTPPVVPSDSPILLFKFFFTEIQQYAAGLGQVAFLVPGETGLDGEGRRQGTTDDARVLAGNIRRQETHACILLHQTEYGFDLPRGKADMRRKAVAGALF